MKTNHNIVRPNLLLLKNMVHLIRKHLMRMIFVMGLCFSLVATAYAIPMYEYAEGKIVGITGLTFNDDIWNLSLVGSPYDSLYSSVSEPVVLFEESFALAATDALTTFISSNGLPAPDSFFGCNYYANCNITTVYDYDMLSSNVSGYATRVNPPIASTTSIHIGAHLDYSSVTYASWSQVIVPVPGAALLLLSGLLALLAIRPIRRL